jgi:hypothetical protein
MLGLDDYIMIAINKFLESEIGEALATTWLYGVLELTWEHLASDKIQRMEEKEVAELARVREDMQRKIDYYESAARDRKTVKPWREPGLRIFGLKPSHLVEIMIVTGMIGFLAGVLHVYETIGGRLTPGVIEKMVGVAAIGIIVTFLMVVILSGTEPRR